jgi:hypothetical protein
MAENRYTIPEGLSKWTRRIERRSSRISWLVGWVVVDDHRAREGGTPQGTRMWVQISDPRFPGIVRLVFRVQRKVEVDDHPHHVRPDPFDGVINANERISPAGRPEGKGYLSRLRTCRSAGCGGGGGGGTHRGGHRVPGTDDGRGSAGRPSECGRYRRNGVHPVDRRCRRRRGRGRCHRRRGHGNVLDAREGRLLLLPNVERGGARSGMVGCRGLGKEGICAVRRIEGRLEGDGWKNAGLWEWRRIRAGEMGEWPHIPGEKASLRRDLRGRKGMGVSTKVPKIEKKVV